MEVEVTELLKLLDDPGIRNVAVDFHRCAYFGSSAMGALIRIARVVRARGGEMVLSNLSECGRELLDIAFRHRLMTERI